MKEFLFARMTWMVETIDQMLAGTARKKVDEEEEEDISNEEEEEEEVELEGATEDGETGDDPISGELTPLECQINDNSAFHQMPGRLNTRIHACKTCGIRLLDFTMAIHRHESHPAIVQHADGVEEKAHG